MTPRPAASIPRRRLAAIAAGIVGAVLLLTWLFLRADAVAPQSHFDYAQELRRLRQADVELSAAVLARHFDLLPNYDPLVRHVRTAREAGARVARPPDFLAAADRARVTAKAKELLAIQEEKEQLVDLFKREHAVLRNSLAYFPGAADAYLRQADGRDPVGFGRFARRLLAFTRNPDGDQARQLETERQALASAKVPAQERPILDHLLLHSRIILERQPAVSSLSREILHLPTADRHEELARLYAAGYDHALLTAKRFRILLYLAALLLVAYLTYAFLRLDKARRALAAAHDDLSERFEAQRRAEERLRLYATVFTNAAEGMVITGADSRIAAVNPAFCAITGYTPDEAIGQTPALLNSGRHDRDYYRQMWAELGQCGQWRGEIWNRRKDGGTYPEWLSITAVPNERGATSHYIGIFSDITERKEAEARIHHLAHHDALTGLPNRILLQDRIDQAILQSKRSGRHTAVLFLDLDRFKNINDTLGHDIGDSLLIQVAERAGANLRETDTISRLGGDEFVIILPDLDHAQDAAQVARKLVRTLASPYLLAGHDLTVTGSIGIALYPTDGHSVSELLRNADTAMYRAKDQGRNGFQFYSADMNAASLGELLLESQLRGALERNELLVHYQPKVDAASGALMGSEALLRWDHPELGLVPPARFIPVAEECGLIGPIGEWVLRSVCRQLRAWLDAGLPVLPVSVNISAHQFAHQDVPVLVADALAESRLAPELLELELTETLLMHNVAHAASVLGNLRGMKVRLAIDDFGTGYSSLSYLRQFPVQTLKIDQSFVQDIGDDGEAVKIAAAIIALAHGMDLAVIAEGVETEAQRRYLAEHGCDQFQGFLFSRPVPAEEMAALLRG